MSVIRTTPEKLPGQIRARNSAARTVLRTSVHRAAQRSRSMMVRETPVDQGQLKASWKVKKYKPVKSGELAELINDAPHAGIIELGARPHPVSRQGWWMIYFWVVRNRSKFSQMRTKSGRPRRVVSTKIDPQIAAITYGIVNKIKREGQKPTFMLRNTLDRHRNIMLQEVVARMNRLASRQPRGKK